MSQNQGKKWEEFLQTATSAEVFQKIGKTITFNEAIPVNKRQEMSRKIWDRWEYVQKHKQTDIYQKASDPNWWGVD